MKFKTTAVHGVLVPLFAFGIAAGSAHAQTYPQVSQPQAMSAPKAGASETLDNIRKRGKLIVASEQKFPGMNVKDSATGRNEGFMADLARAVAKHLVGDENKVEWIVVDDDTRLSAVATGKADMILDTTGKSDEKGKVVDFTTEETFRSGSGLLVKKGSPIKSLADIHKGTRVLYVKANPDIKHIKAKAPDATYIEFENSKDAVEALKAGKGDVFTQVVTHLFRTASQEPDYVVVNRFTNKAYNILIKKGDTVFRDDLDAFLRSMKASGEYDRLYDKWFGKYGGANVDFAHSPKS